jgi:phage tail sheath gpL-like
MSNASIVLVGLGSSFPNPGTYLELDFAQGPVSGTGAARGCLLMGNKTTAGTATADTVVYSASSQTPCATENDVITLFGSGSQVHRMFLRFLAAAGPNNTTPLYFLAVTESAGAQATLVETITTNAIANATHRTWCEDQFVDSPITNGDTVSTIAANIATAVNSQGRWPVTAANLSAVVTYTARNKGPEGNWIRMQALVFPATASNSTTSLTANTFLSGGTTADNNTNALATILPNRYYYIVSADSDATNLGRIATQIGTQAAATVGIRQRQVAASMDTLANVITLATGLNVARGELQLGAALDMAPPELAATAAAIFMTLEQGAAVGVARKNFSLFPASAADQPYFPVLPGRAGSTGAWTQAQITSALNNGVTPWNVLPNGQAQLVKRVTTRSLNGSVQDYRIRDAHKVTVCDYFCDDVVAMTQLQFGGCDLLPDPVQGQPPPASGNPNNKVVTPGLWGAEIKNVIEQYGNANQWTYIPGYVSTTLTPAQVIESLMVGPQIEVSPPTRMSVQIPLAPCSIADQFAILAQQVA